MEKSMEKAMKKPVPFQIYSIYRIYSAWSGILTILRLDSICQRTTLV